MATPAHTTPPGVPATARLPHTRRGFLRGLASLPLIGGSIALLGHPSAAAVVPTPALLERYVAWLANEHAAAAAECDRSFDYDQEIVHGSRRDWHYHRVRAPLFWYPDAPDVEDAVRLAPPSSRAAVMLSAAGVPLATGACDA